MQNFREIRPASTISTHGGGHDIEGASQHTPQLVRDHEPHILPSQHVVANSPAGFFGGSAGHRHGAGNTSSAIGLPVPLQQGPQRIESIVLPRRKRSVIQACRDCRKTKAKCGGQRPKCNNCKTKGRQCGYDGEEGQSRYKAMKSRLALLEKTMQQLRKSSPEQTARLVEELKQTPDEFWAPMAAIDEEEGTPPATMSTPEAAGVGNPATNATTGTTPTLQHASSSNSLENTSTTSQSQTTASSSRNNSGGGQSMSGQGQQEHTGMDMEVEEASPLRERASVSTEPPLLSPTPWQLWDNSNITASNHSSGIVLPIPDLETTNAAINEYFIRIDRLFQPFSRDELKSLHRIASGLSSSTETDRKQQQQIALSCLTAVASLGSQCLMDAQSNSRIQEHEAFTNIARHYLDVVIEHEPRDAVRVCALLAGTVIMNKPGLALSYVETGINLFSRAYRMDHDAAAQQKEHQLLGAPSSSHGVSAPPLAQGSGCQGMMSPTISLQAQLAMSSMSVPAHKETIGHGRSWRTLVFLASWLSSAHGYIIGSDLLVERQLSPEAEPAYPENGDLVEITEIALTCLCYIKSSILRLRAANRDLTPYSIRHVLLSLRHWYHTLPPSIQLNFHNLSHFSPSGGSPFPGLQSTAGPSASSGTTSSLLETHRSIHHIHILYSDSITLLYRWLISQSITCRLHGNHEGHHALDTPLRELLLEHADDAIRVAGLSAVVLRRMIHNDEEILMPCWTAGFQAYTSCAVLLWSVVGKVVNGVGMSPPLRQEHGGGKESREREREWEGWQNRYGWQGELERVRDCLVVLELCARLGGGRDGAERWYRRMKALLKAVEGSESYRRWEEQQRQQRQQDDYHQSQQNQHYHGHPDHAGRNYRPQQQQRPPSLALEPQDRSYLLTLPSPHVHARATNGQPIDYALARVSVSLIMLLHQSFGAPGSQKLEGVPDDEFAAGDWGRQHSRRGSAAAGGVTGVGAGEDENGNGNGMSGSLDLENEQKRILEWLGWDLPLPSHVVATGTGAGAGSGPNAPGNDGGVQWQVPVDPAIIASGGYQGQGMGIGLTNSNQGDHQGSSSGAGAAGSGYQQAQGSMGMGMMRMDLGR